MCRADTKVCVSEPTLARRSGEDHQIKATPGINSASSPSFINIIELYIHVDIIYMYQLCMMVFVKLELDNKSMLSRLSVRTNMITAYNGERIERSFLVQKHNFYSI